MTLSEFTEEIISSLSTYEQDIDRVAIKMNVINQLKILGSDICELTEDVITVENSKAKLPENFKSLKLALKLTPTACEFDGDRSQLQTDNYIYRQYIENPAYFDEINMEYVRSCKSKIITEKITIGNQKLDLHHTYTWLSLVKGLNKNNISPDCLNLSPRIRNNYPNKININGHYLNTNFPEGKIYIKYYGYPTDEEGEIIIPEITTGDIFRYLENYVKTKIAEDLIANNKNPQGIGQLYSVWKGQEREFKRAAIVEAKMASFSKDWHKKYKRINQREFSRYNLPSLKF